MRFHVRLRRPLGLAAVLAITGHPAVATAASNGDRAGTATDQLSHASTLVPQLLEPRDAQSIGSISVAHPHAGYLFNGVQLPEHPHWVRTVPEQSWGTEETIRAIMHCIGRVQEQFPHSPPAMIGAISAKGGGPLAPHKSHRTGRDADIYLYRTGGKWYQAATEDDLDRPRSWALLKAVATETDVDMILLDIKLQKLLEAHALSIGEDPVWVEDLFHGRGRYPNPLVKHVPGHVAHMHVRFTSPIARERGRLAYDQLVELGHIDLPTREIAHEVRRGDTLSAIAEEHNTSVETIMGNNGLASTTIYVGQRLVIQHRQDLRDAHAPVIVPQRRLPRRDSGGSATPDRAHAKSPSAGGDTTDSG